MPTQTDRIPIAERLAAPMRRIPILPAVAVIGLVIGVLAVLGIMQRTVHPEWIAANLDAETSAGKWVGAGLLWVAAGVWFLVAATGASVRPWVWIWWPILAWLAADEGNAFHERLERWLEIDWQVLYAPLIAVAALSWWGVFRAHRRQRTVAVLLIAGAGAWAVPLLLELIQNWGGEPIGATLYDPMMITEEILEMIGATIFAIAGLKVLRDDPADPGTP